MHGSLLFSLDAITLASPLTLHLSMAGRDWNSEKLILLGFAVR